MPNADNRVESPSDRGSRSQPENGSTTSDSVQANWPSTSSSPVTPTGRPGSPRASTPSSSSTATGSSPRSPDVSRPARLGRLDRHRHGQRRDRRGRGPGDHGTADLHPGRVLRGAPAGDRAWATWSSRPAPSGSSRPRASSSTMGIPAVADYEAVAALIEAAERLGHRYHVGITATAPGFFGAQGRPIPQLPIRYPDLAEEMARQRVLNFEMEASALLVLATLAPLPSRRRLCGLRQPHDRRLRRGRARRTRPRRPASRPGSKPAHPGRDGSPEARSRDGPLATVALATQV